MQFSLTGGRVCERNATRDKDGAHYYLPRAETSVRRGMQVGGFRRTVHPWTDGQHVTGTSILQQVESKCFQE